jgi:lambda repressor-like predicted transcriptional regulator
MAVEIDFEKIATDPDYISIKRYNNSLAKIMDRYENGCPAHIIAKALGISETEIEQRYQNIILTLRKEMCVA